MERKKKKYKDVRCSLLPSVQINTRNPGIISLNFLDRKRKQEQDQDGKETRRFLCAKWSQNKATGFSFSFFANAVRKRKRIRTEVKIIDSPQFLSFIFFLLFYVFFHFFLLFFSFFLFFPGKRRRWEIAVSVFVRARRRKNVVKSENKRI